MQAPFALKSPAREVVFESELISVWYYPELRLISHQIHKMCHGPTFREALWAGTAALQRYGAAAWLSDDRLNGPLPDADEEWGNGTWFPATKAAGWKYWAMVLPAKAVGKLNVKRIVAAVCKQGIEAQMFTEPGPALDWLREQIKVER